MEELTIQYSDFSGAVTWRRISDYRAETADSIDAFCHERNARRTFKVANILGACDAKTGEVIANVWRHFGLSRAGDGREILASLLFEVLPAVKALKFFAMSSRGFGKEERKHLVRFVRERVDLPTYSDAELEEWLQQLWCGDVVAFRNGATSEYEQLLRSVPNSLKAPSRIAARLIAAGSGRQPIEPDLDCRVEIEFS